MEGGKDDKKSGRGRLEVLKRQETIRKDVAGRTVGGGGREWEKKSPLLKVGGNKRQRADKRVRRGLRRTERSQLELQGKGGEIQGRGVLYENRLCQSSPRKESGHFSGDGT